AQGKRRLHRGGTGLSARRGARPRLGGTAPPPRPPAKASGKPGRRRPQLSAGLAVATGSRRRVRRAAPIGGPLRRDRPAPARRGRRRGRDRNGRRSRSGRRGPAHPGRHPAAGRGAARRRRSAGARRAPTARRRRRRPLRNRTPGRRARSPRRSARPGAGLRRLGPDRLFPERPP
ncbi:hypothetical protein D1614_25030, partial [Maribellus luteus]